jgi:hypothetical protein
MIEIFFACSYALFLLYVWYRNLGREAQEEHSPHIEQYKDNDQRVGFATGKWSDDDYKGPITPFIGPIR